MALSRKTKIIVGISLVALLTIITIVSVLATRKDTPEVTVITVESKPLLKSTVTSSGEVRPIQFMNLTSEVQGRIEEIYHKEGEKVLKGEPLVRLDPTQLQSGTDAQLAAFQTAQDDVRSSQTQVTAAQNQLVAVAAAAQCCPGRHRFGPPECGDRANRRRPGPGRSKCGEP